MIKENVINVSTKKRQEEKRRIWSNGNSERRLEDMIKKIGTMKIPAMRRVEMRKGTIMQKKKGAVKEEGKERVL